MITRRGKKVRGLALALVFALILWGLWQITANLWATPSGWCWGSMIECVKL